MLLLDKSIMFNELFISKALDKYFAPRLPILLSDKSIPMMFLFRIKASEIYLAPISPNLFELRYN